MSDTPKAGGRVEFATCTREGLPLLVEHVDGEYWVWDWTGGLVGRTPHRRIAVQMTHMRARFHLEEELGHA